MKRISFYLPIFLFSICCILLKAETKTYHVNINNGNDSNDGMEWNSALKNLQVALDSAKVGDTIWVAAGKYKPTKKYANMYKDGTQTTDRNRSFIVPAGVKIFGGFPANATNTTDLNSRDWNKNETILTGDFNDNDDFEFGGINENAYHVIIIFDATDETTLDGFYIYGGNSNETETAYHNGNNAYPVTYGCGGAIYCFSNVTSASPTLKNLIIQANYASYEGGGLFNYAPSDEASPTITNVQFINNVAKTKSGGGLYIEGRTSKATITNTVITGNNADKNGGGAYFKTIEDCTPKIQNTLIAGNLANVGGGLFFNSWSGTTTPTLINTTISGNRAKAENNINNNNDGGGMTVFAEIGIASPIIQNTVISNNKGDKENEILIIGIGGTNPTYEYSFVKGLNLGGSNLDGDIDPMFANPADADFAPTGNDYHNYQLRLESPLINKGNNAFLTLTEDLNGSTRVYDGKIDIGAYESQGTVPVFNETIMSEKSIWSYQGKLYVHIGDKNISMNVYSVNGMLVKQINGLGEGTYEYSLPQGCYIVTLNNGTTQKVIIR